MKQETAQHTPGPWKISPYCSTNICNGEETRHIASAGHATRASRWPEDEANARLIAAAPLLLEALKIQTAKITRYFETPPSKRGYFEAVDFNKEATAAIAATQP